MKLEETDNLKLQYVKNIQITTSQINNINDSDRIIEKITENFHIYEKNSNFKGKTSSTKWYNYCQRNELSIAECRKKTTIYHKNIENLTIHFINT